MYESFRLLQARYPLSVLGNPGRYEEDISCLMQLLADIRGFAVLCSFYLDLFLVL